MARARQSQASALANSHTIQLAATEKSLEIIGYGKVGRSINPAHKWINKYRVLNSWKKDEELTMENKRTAAQEVCSLVVIRCPVRGSASTPASCHHQSTLIKAARYASAREYRHQRDARRSDDNLDDDEEEEEEEEEEEQRFHPPPTAMSHQATTRRSRPPQKLFVLCEGGARINNSSDGDTPFDCGAHGYCFPENRTTTASDKCVSCSQCYCPDGTVQVSTNECQAPSSCVPNPCTNANQECQVDAGNAKCVCLPGYTGSDCSYLATDPCSKEPCLQGGACSSIGSDYTCTCPTGYYGTQCQYEGDPCSGYCQNGGTCEMVFQGTTPHCICPFEYIGENCETKRNVQTSFVDCFDDSAASFTDYYVYPLAISKGTDCRDALIDFRKANPESNYAFSTMSGTRQKCLFSTTNQLTVTPKPRGLLGGLLNALLNTCAYSTLDAGLASVYELNDICAMDPCRENVGQGYCVQLSSTSRVCKCNPLNTGTYCGMVATLTPCDGIDCGAGTCEVTDDQIGHYCKCSNVKKLTPCEADPCGNSECLYGGTCVDLGNGNYTCDCLNLYTGDRCEIYEPCVLEQCENGGTCVPEYNLLDSKISCECTSDWKGDYCEEVKLACDEMPCKNGAICNDIIGPPNTYNCTCTPQWEGFNCTSDIDECALDVTLCKSKDPGAQCVNTNGSYYCVCSANMFGAGCAYNKIIYEIINSTYGGMNETEMEQMVEELTNDPTLVRDIVPFLIGGYSEETRISLSWSAEDMFLWVAYEKELIDVKKNFYSWNDKVLGNCFTFNHLNASYQYLTRSPGYAGGLEIQMNVKQDEYLPWIDTAAIQVFTSTTEEIVTSESPRVNCPPKFESNIAIDRKDYIRLGGRYGKCASSIEDVGSYYYAGEYTTDGCLRSCYQDVVQNACTCMDPRYPMPAGASSCNITKKNCIDDLLLARGDPSQWEECDCPLRCSERIYTAKLTRLTFTKKMYECEQNFLAVNKRKCYNTSDDMVLIRIGLPKLTYFIYQEQPAMDFSKFMSYTGGLCGVLAGLSIVAFIELIFLIFKLLLILIANREI
ncbi:unnamed protein product [Caenorhabditis bovis]|uniref:EGF-like domain-containing protein n=1 Tax=Caenorhabditis bovis TaxID=2654633 RepID=A0A8S1FAP2_9PELO|nr:unnamed protein product [Caenorhabditis bovis]